MTGFNKKEIEDLLDNAKNTKLNGAPLVNVFYEHAKKYKRSSGSVRNFYYQYLKEKGENLGVLSVTSLKSFTKCETVELVKKILVGTSKGASVRSVIAKMSSGDEKLALRIQNKFRTTISKDRELVENVKLGLKLANVQFKDPYKCKRGDFLKHRLSKEIDNLFDKVKNREKNKTEELLRVIEKLTLENEQLRKSKVLSIYKNVEKIDQKN